MRGTIFKNRFNENPANGIKSNHSELSKFNRLRSLKKYLHQSERAVDLFIRRRFNKRAYGVLCNDKPMYVEVILNHPITLTSATGHRRSVVRKENEIEHVNIIFRSGVGIAITRGERSGWLIYKNGEILDKEIFVDKGDINKMLETMDEGECREVYIYGEITNWSHEEENWN